MTCKELFKKFIEKHPAAIGPLYKDDDWTGVHGSSDDVAFCINFDCDAGCPVIQECKEAFPNIPFFTNEELEEIKAEYPEYFI